MNKFDYFITDYLREYKEVALEKIGTVKTLSFSETDTQAASVEFTCNKKITTTPQLIDYIAQKAAKNKHLIAADLESHFSQVREFINIGKSYEIPMVGFIKANKTGVYEFLPYSVVQKPLRTSPQPVKDRPAGGNRSVVQVISVLIVVAILAGLGWQAYEFFRKKDATAMPPEMAVQDTLVADTIQRADTTALQPVTYGPNDTVAIRYIFETTASALRARTRTAQLRGFGNAAGYDSSVNNSVTYYNLYVEKATRLSDTLRVKDSIAKFFLKDIRLQIVPK